MSTLADLYMARLRALEPCPARAPSTRARPRAARRGVGAVMGASRYVAEVRAARKQIVTRALLRRSGNRVRAARDLGIAHPNLQRLIRELGVDVPPDHEFRHGWPRGKRRKGSAV